VPFRRRQVKDPAGNRARRYLQCAVSGTARDSTRTFYPADFALSVSESKSRATMLAQ
jgi:hypothetical protein